MVKIAGFIILILLSGCTKEVYVDRPVITEVPVLEIPAIKPLEKPVLPIKNITTNSNPKEVAEAYVNSLYRLNNYCKKLEVLLIPFFKKYEESYE